MKKLCYLLIPLLIIFVAVLFLTRCDAPAAPQEETPFTHGITPTIKHPEPTYPEQTQPAPAETEPPASSQTAPKDDPAPDVTQPTQPVQTDPVTPEPTQAVSEPVPTTPQKEESGFYQPILRP